MPDEPSFEDVLAAVARGEKVTAESLEGALSAHAALSRDLVRWKLARWIIWLYVGVVGATALHIFIRGIWAGADVWEPFFELIKIGVLPALTLVMGFYFGVARRGTGGG